MHDRQHWTDLNQRSIHTFLVVCLPFDVDGLFLLNVPLDLLQEYGLPQLPVLHTNGAITATAGQGLTWDRASGVGPCESRLENATFMWDWGCVDEGGDWNASAPSPAYLLLGLWSWSCCCLWWASWPRLLASRHPSVAWGCQRHPGLSRSECRSRRQGTEHWHENIVLII